MGLAHSPRIVTNGLVLCLDAGNTKSYPGSGTTWTDLSGNGNNGTLTNGPTFDSGNGGSIVFDGVDDCVTFASNPTLTNQITVEVWVALSATVNTDGWVMGREGSYRILYSVTNSSFGWICATVNNAWYTTGTAISCVATPATNKYQVVGTYDGSNLRIYLNGILQTTGAAISGNIVSVNNYNLMRDDSGAAAVDNGKGKIYSHKLYNRALSAEEVLQNYIALKGRFGL